VQNAGRQYETRRITEHIKELGSSIKAKLKNHLEIICFHTTYYNSYS